MVVFVGTPQFRRIPSWVAMETMHLIIARISVFMGKFFGGLSELHMNNLTAIKTCPGVASLVKLNPRVLVT